MSDERERDPGLLVEVVPGILDWSGRHPNHGGTVHSHFLTEQRVAIDPIGAPGLIEELERAGGVAEVLLTNRHHQRGSEEIVAAFGAALHVPRSGLDEFGAADRPDPVGYDWGEEIVEGVTAHEVGSLAPDDGALHIEVGPGALALADSVVGDDQGLGFVPDSLMDDPEETKRGLLGSLHGLLALDFDVLLLAHGAPVASGGKRALETFVAEPRTASLG